MLDITDRTGELLEAVLEQVQAPRDRRIRLDFTALGGRLTLDREQPGDEVISYQGRPVLVIDAYTAEECAHRVLDFNGEALVLLELRGSPLNS